MIPSGFERLLLGHAVAVARSDVADNVRRALVSADGTRATLHEFAAKQPGARKLQGRGTAYGVALPVSGLRVVVRHNHHGGMFAGITGDRFLSPTRAPYELEMSLALGRLGIPTPDVLAYVLYPPGGLFQRSDVCSREIGNSRDLAHILANDGGPERAAALATTASLLGALARAGARHSDLNAKNILVTYETAYVLDVDRLILGSAGEHVIDANYGRLARSIRKWREQFGARVTEKDLTELETAARHAFQRSLN
jgi:hypothetical protein